jgi:cysteine desulfurase
VRAYLDHAATTPMRPQAREAMLPYLGDRFGNPSGSHAESRRARLTVDDARDQVAALLGLGSGQGDVIFTGSGTEADNLAVLGTLAGAAGERRGLGPVVCTAMEHHAVLNTCRAAAGRYGVELRQVSVTKEGVVDLDALSAACTPDVSLVSVMAVNNEIGTVQPLAEVASLVRRRSPRAVLHTDAIQAVPWLDTGEWSSLVDLLSVSAHKFGGPQGVGALVACGATPLGPIMYGGGQERERRSGTHNVAGIAGLAAALAVTVEDRPATVARVTALRDRLVDGLVTAIPGSTETGDRARKVAGHAHLRFAGVEAEALVVLLDEAGVAASAGAACSSGAVGPSHVLVSMGLSDQEAATGVRFSLGWTTTPDEVDHALAVVPSAVAQLRR